jgi:hypothetical protein
MIDLELSRRNKILNLAGKILVQQATIGNNFLKGTVSRDNLYSIFFIDHSLLVSLEVLYEDFKFRRIFAVLFNQKGNSPVQATQVSPDSSV